MIAMHWLSVIRSTPASVTLTLLPVSLCLCLSARVVRTQCNECNDCSGCDQLTRSLRMDGYPAAAIHGDKSQDERDRTLLDFRGGRCMVLVATDVAARGLDIKEVTMVVNFDMPSNAEDYVHRIGRCGRAGATGTSMSFFTRKNARMGECA